MDTLTENGQPGSSPDSRTFLRLTSAQVQIFRDRINADRTINLTDTARKVGMSRSMLYYIIRGRNRTTPENIRSIAEILKIDPKEIFV